MIEVRPYIIIPNLIAQPTWGGEYIAAHKRLPSSRLINTLIGRDTYKNSFHDLFVQSSSITIKGSNTSSTPYQISQGFGIFIPACIECNIQSTSEYTVILNTFVE